MKSPRLVSCVRTRLRRASSGTPACPTTTSSSRLTCASKDLHDRRDVGIGGQAGPDLVERPRALAPPAVATEPQVHLHQVARVRAGLGDEGLALLGDQRLVLVAAQDQIHVGALGHRAVLAHVQVRDGDDHLRTALPQIVAHLAGRGDRLADLDLRPRAGALHDLGGGEPEHADPDAGQREHHLALGAAERSTVAPIEHVGGEPYELRLAHSLGQHRGAEVELVVAEGGQVQAQRVQSGDHVPPLQQRGGHGGRQRVAAQDHQGRGILAADRLTSVASRAIPPRRPSSTGSRV